MPRENPYDSKEEELAAQILHHLRKPRELLDEDDKERIINKAEELAHEVHND